jgi:hypothetical protein
MRHTAYSSFNHRISSGDRKRAVPERPLVQDLNESRLNEGLAILIHIRIQVTPGLSG